MVDGEGRHFDVEAKRLEAPHAFQFDRLDEMARYPERAFRNPQVERVSQRPGADHAFRGQFGNRTFLPTFEMKAIGLDLTEMDFHLSFLLSSIATRPGTKSFTSPPSRAISFTIRELR